VGQALVRDLQASGEKLSGKEADLRPHLKSRLLGLGQLISQFRVEEMQMKGLVALQSANEEGLAEIDRAILGSHDIPSWKRGEWFARWKEAGWHPSIRGPRPFAAGILPSFPLACPEDIMVSFHSAE
jgi:hypothetical protein